MIFAFCKMVGNIAAADSLRIVALYLFANTHSRKGYANEFQSFGTNERGYQISESDRSPNSFVFLFSCNPRICNFSINRRQTPNNSSKWRNLCR